MKKIVLICVTLVVTVWTLNSLAETVGVVDLRQILKVSTQVKSINKKIDSQFTGRRAEVQKIGTALQADLKKLQKNQSVMSKSDLDKLKKSVMQQESTLRQKQAVLQQAYFSAQNMAINNLMHKIQSISASIASSKKLDVVLTKNGVLYAKDEVDITSDVLTQLGR